jgi:5-methylcytosine-specific restriction endonuclease McrA
MAGARGARTLTQGGPALAIYLPQELRDRIDEADRGRCRYCLMAEANSGVRLTYDHIVPRSKGGATSFENVCLACSACNEHKAAAMVALDPFTG